MPTVPTKRQPQPPAQPPHLVVPRAEAAERIKAHLDRGVELKNQPITTYGQLKDAEEGTYRWGDRTHTILSNLFDTMSVADANKMIAFGGSAADIEPLGRAIEFLKDTEWRSRLNMLQSVLERLDDYAEVPRVPATATPSSGQSDPSASKRVFVVHGHDNEAKESTARFLSILGLQPIILHERVNAGQFLLDKLESNIAEVGFAVVLLTADDVGAEKGKETALKPRARQNVILELGYVLRALGRARVCALYQEGVELPTDISGWAYVPMDPAGAWKVRLALELKAAGYTVSLDAAYEAG